MSKIEENTQIPSTHKTEGHTDGLEASHGVTHEETKHLKDGQKNGMHRTRKGRVKADGGPVAALPCCVL